MLCKVRRTDVAGTEVAMSVRGSQLICSFDRDVVDVEDRWRWFEARPRITASVAPVAAGVRRNRTRIQTALHSMHTHTHTHTLLVLVARRAEKHRLNFPIYLPTTLVAQAEKSVRCVCLCARTTATLVDLGQVRRPRSQVTRPSVCLFVCHTHYTLNPGHSQVQRRQMRRKNRCLWPPI